MAPATIESGVARGLHAWQQDEVEADMLIRYFSKQRDLVIDRLGTQHLDCQGIAWGTLIAWEHSSLGDLPGDTVGPARKCCVPAQMHGRTAAGADHHVRIDQQAILQIGIRWPRTVGSANGC